MNVDERCESYGRMYETCCVSLGLQYVNEITDGGVDWGCVR